MEITNSKSQIPNPPAGEAGQIQNPSNPPSDLRLPSISLYWGLRYEEDMYWDKEFCAIAEQYTGFQYYLCLSKPSDGWEKSIPPLLSVRRAKGHVTEHVLKNSSFAKPACRRGRASADKEKNLQNCEFYLCGNRSMIEEMVVRLQDKNIEDERIKTDMYY